MGGERTSHVEGETSGRGVDAADIYEIHSQAGREERTERIGTDANPSDIT